MYDRIILITILSVPLSHIILSVSADSESSNAVEDSSSFDTLGDSSSFQAVEDSPSFDDLDIDAILELLEELESDESESDELLPSNDPSTSPSFEPTASPSYEPTMEPTNNPSSSPSKNPSAAPSTNPSSSPSDSPTMEPTQPSKAPSSSPVGPVVCSEEPSGSFTPCGVNCVCATPQGSSVQTCLEQICPATAICTNSLACQFFGPPGATICAADSCVAPFNQLRCFKACSTPFGVAVANSVYQQVHYEQNNDNDSVKEDKNISIAMDISTNVWILIFMVMICISVWIYNATNMLCGKQTHQSKVNIDEEDQ